MILRTLGAHPLFVSMMEQDSTWTSSDPSINVPYVLNVHPMRLVPPRPTVFIETLGRWVCVYEPSSPVRIHYPAVPWTANASRMSIVAYGMEIVHLVHRTISGSDIGASIRTFVASGTEEIGVEVTETTLVPSADTNVVSARRSVDVMVDPIWVIPSTETVPGLEPTLCVEVPSTTIGSRVETRVLSAWIEYEVE